MPYKIYTYADPYKLNQADFWGEISAIPHFCGSRTLVNGLKAILRNDIKGLLCPFNDLINHPDVYGAWTEAVSRQVQQYSELTAYFSFRRKQGDIDRLFHESLSKNQSHFLEAVRLFIALGISASAFDGTKGNPEQRFFVETLEHFQTEQSFLFPKTPGLQKLKNIIVRLSENELKEYENKKIDNPDDIAWYKRAVSNTERLPLRTIVVHDVHQFSPAQIRFLAEAERAGLTVIFLFNYQERYSQIYASWINIYRCFGAPVHHDKNIPAYVMPAVQNPGNALACAIGEIFQNPGHAGRQNIRRLYQIYKNIPYMEFANITEYAHYVSNHFDSAIKSYSESRSVLEQGNHIWSNTAVLRSADEQVYTANKAIHTLLKIYYPEYTKDRHFLAYPIGQFFSALYHLWDYECGAIRMDVPLLKECLTSHVLKSGRGEELLRTFCNLELLFEKLSSFEDFEREIEKSYADRYRRITSAGKTDELAPFRSLSIYNRYKVSEKDIQGLIAAVNEINEIGARFFANNKKEEYIHIGRHFQRLEEFLRQRELTLATEQEQRLIRDLMSRLARIKPEKTSFSSTFRDLQQGLHYYLKQDGGDDDNGADWIVKNFEQIGGDILQTRRQFENGVKKAYHFACLSECDLNCQIDDLLPWPLTDAFIGKALSFTNLQFQVYYASLRERSGFLRYSLFYGLFYNHCDAVLSYVRQYEDDETEPYTLLSILGLPAKPCRADALEAEDADTFSLKPQAVQNIPYRPYEMMDMFLCPYRYFLDYVMEDAPVIQGNFLYQKFYENYIISAVWKSIAGMQKNHAQSYLSRRVRQESKKIERCFRFWNQSELDDLNRRAENYLLHRIIEESRGYAVQPFDEDFMTIRKQFGVARFDVDIADAEPKHLYAPFENCTSAHRAKSVKVYSLPQFITKKKNVNEKAALSAAVKQYLETSSERSAAPSSWCLYCVHKGNCMEPFLKVE